MHTKDPHHQEPTQGNRCQYAGDDDQMRKQQDKTIFGLFKICKPKGKASQSQKANDTQGQQNQNLIKEDKGKKEMACTLLLAKRNTCPTRQGGTGGRQDHTPRSTQTIYKCNN